MHGKDAAEEKKIYQKPKRFFEKSGSVDPSSSYYVPLENVANSDNQEVKTMVERGRYFSIFAPRQSGKTTYLKHLCKELHEDSTYIAIILSFQKYKNLNRRKFYSQVQKKFYTQLLERLTLVGCQKLDIIRSYLDHHILTDHLSFGELFEELNRIIEFKKLVLFIDEFDGIPREELENFLTTLRDLYLEYKEVKPKALYSIGLVGIRNITKLIVGGVSPFNIADQVDLPPFSLKNVRELYSQYTEETNQPFTDAAVKKVYEETSGQPWLVNRLGTLLTVEIKPATVESIDENDVDKAITALLQEKNDHFDNLYEKAKLYKETFVEIVFDHVNYSAYNEDQNWLEQYGLIKRKNGHAVVTNNIYKALFLKTFFEEAGVQPSMPVKDYALPGNKLDMNRILLDFDRYIARIGVRAFYEEDKPYEKTGQFLLTAWLYQFAMDGDGDLRYEVFSGLGRMDILLFYKGSRYVIETKVNRHDDVSAIESEGIRQLTEKYLVSEGIPEGYLVIYDTKTHVGAICEPRGHKEKDKLVTSFIIGIGKEK